MSLIRPLSNPEGLYVYEDSDRYVHVDGGLPAPLSGTGRLFPALRIPAAAFYRAVDAWRRRGDSVYADGVRIDEQIVEWRTGRTTHQKPSRGDVPRTEYLIRLAYGRRYIRMWPVTWEYIVDRYHERRVLDLQDALVNGPLRRRLSDPKFIRAIRAVLAEAEREVALGALAHGHDADPNSEEAEHAARAQATYDLAAALLGAFGGTRA